MDINVFPNMNGFINEITIFPNEIDIKKIEIETQWISKFVLDKTYQDYRQKKIPLYHVLPSLYHDITETSTLLETYNETFDFSSICLEYPILKSLLTQRMENKKNYLEAIKRDFALDKKVIEQLLNTNLGKIKSMETGHGDVHQHGKSAAIITFENETKLMYKPRSGGMDIAFERLISHFNTANIGKDLRVPKVYDCGDHCWVEFIAHTPCQTKEELTDYYIRAGELLAFMYILNGADLHFENIIAQGAYPILIDLECLFNDICSGQYNVLKTALIPVLRFGKNGDEPYDVSGFGAIGTQKLDNQAWVWKYIGKDALSLERGVGVFKAEHNLPVYNNKKYTPGNFLNEIIKGFTIVCDWVQSLSQELNNDDHPFIGFKDQIFRILPRGTKTYMNIIENSLVPDVLITENLRLESIKKDSNQTYYNIENKKYKDEIFAKEIDAIMRLDVPYFVGNTSKKHIKECNSLVTDHFFENTPYEIILSKLKHLNQKEVDHQIAMITSAFAARYSINTTYNIQEKKGEDIQPSKLKNAILEEIDRIAGTIESSCLHLNNTFEWQNFEPNGDLLELRILGDSFYSGKLGIAFFLSAISKYKETSIYDTTITTVLQNSIDKILSENKEEIDISFGTGISGLIYTLMQVDLKKYVKTIDRLLDFIDEKTIHGDTTFDILKGTAGCLAVLCTLYEKTKGQKALDKCVLIGEYLLKNRVITHSGYKSWKTISEVPLTGFSHGASGISHALLQLYKITKSVKYQNASYEALAYENTSFDTEKSNWQDLRAPQKMFQNCWCHGATGIGLSRLQAYEIMKNEHLKIDIDRVMKSYEVIQKPGIDHYCCGNAGRIDFLIEKYQYDKDEQSKAYLDMLLLEVLNNKNKSGYFNTYNTPNISMENPSLFLGISGIGYVLLRAIDPISFPSFGLMS